METNTGLFELPLDKTDPEEFSSEVLNGMDEGLSYYEARKQAMRMYSYS